MDTERLRYAFHGHIIAEPLQGCDGPLTVTFLLFGSLVRVALLLIRGPLPEQMIHDHQHRMPHGHGGTLAPQKRRSLAGCPRTLDKDASQVAIPFARAPLSTLARTGVIARTDLGPRRQAGGRAKPAHVRANGRNEMDPPLCGSTAMSHNEFLSSEPIEPQEASPMKQEMHVLRIDLAKRVFHAVGMDDRGNVVYRKRLSRHDLMPCIAKLPR